MTISRRQWLAGSALLGPLATHSQPPSRTDPPFHPAIAQALLRHAVNAVNAMLQSPPRDPRPFAAAHAVAELVFAHFEETGFQSMLDQHLAQFGPHMQVPAIELSAMLRNYGMQVPEDLIPRMVAPDAVATAQARQLGWSGLRPLLLRGLEVGMTTLTAPLKMYQRATWEPPWPRIVRKPLLLKDPRLAEELPRLEAAGKVTIHLGVGILTGTGSREAEAAGGAARMASIGGTAAIGIAVAVWLICFHTKKRLVASPSNLPVVS